MQVGILMNQYIWIVSYHVNYPKLKKEILKVEVLDKINYLKLIF